MTRLCKAVAAISLLFCSGAMAQTAPDAKVQAANSAWRKLSQNEVNCVDQSLRTQRTNLWTMIQRGVDPSDSAVARLRAACRTQAKAPEHAPAASQALAAAPDAAAKAAAEKAAAEKLVADKAAVEKAVADKVAAEKAAAEKAAAEKAAAQKVAAEKAAADKAAIELAKADAERAKAASAKEQARPESAPREIASTTAASAAVYSAAELRMNFVYGLATGPALLGVGGVAFLFVRRKRSAPRMRSAIASSDPANTGNQNEFDRLVTAVVAEQRRRERNPEPATSAREPRVDESVLH
jgi:hypothetical protein